MGGVGDVYYCAVEKEVLITSDLIKNVEKEKFKFKQTENGVIFNPKLFFSDEEFVYTAPIEKYNELFFAVFHKPKSSSHITISFTGKTFTASAVHRKFVSTLIADCSKF